MPTTVEHTGDATTVRVRLGATPDGIYVVSWQDVSAADGHVAFGEFAFAGGPISGTVPATAQHGGHPHRCG